jgi:hypothetical protein
MLYLLRPAGPAEESMTPEELNRTMEFIVASFQAFAGIKGSRIYESFRTSSLRYLRFEAIESQ